MSKLKIFLWLTQALNTSMQISRNKRATKKASGKWFMTNIFNFFAKRQFFPQNGDTTKTNYNP